MANTMFNHSLTISEILEADITVVSLEHRTNCEVGLLLGKPILEIQK